MMEEQASLMIKKVENGWVVFKTRGFQTNYAPSGGTWVFNGWTEFIAWLQSNIGPR